ncbi:carboxymethylenebutenolidase [Rhodococcus sp. 27YEA15]|uniref:dienelactone hydrolase family protein n=1 Tax=Rhodococcus sp. 27YEA15 TaxID=3156259 RepID=UPI003C7E7E7D
MTTLAARNEALTADTITISGHGGDEIEAYLATPLDDQPKGGVVLIHHMPGYDWATKELARRFAAHGYNAVCPNLHHRDAPGAEPDEAAAASRAAGGVPDEQLVGDIVGASEHLKELASSNGKVGVIGYCSGGRQAFLAAAEAGVDAAVDCYGPFVIGTPPEAIGLSIGPIVHLAPKVSAPILGLFGADDVYPPKEEAAELESVLKEHGKEVDFHIFDGAGHAFFAVDKPSYRPEVAEQAWALIFNFFGKHLSA